MPNGHLIIRKSLGRKIKLHTENAHLSKRDYRSIIAYQIIKEMYRYPKLIITNDNQSDIQVIIDNETIFENILSLKEIEYIYEDYNHLNGRRVLNIPESICKVLLGTEKGY